MDWIRSHFPYSTINGNNSSMASSISSNNGRHLNGRHHIPKSRLIKVNSEHQPIKYCNNEISTCKYNFFTFLPRFLLEQFRRYSNIFFLFIAILQQIPEVSPTGRHTTAVPFLIILSISAIKEIFEDIKRRRMDNTVNNYKVRVLRGNKLQTCRWKELNVGQIVKIFEGHNFPADIVILSSSESLGMAYIETAQLDGETNLKIRQALPATAELVTDDQLSRLSAEMEVEVPNKKVNEFTGTMLIGDDRLPMSITQLLLRGAKLKNCKWIYGVVIYTGHDSRFLMNSTTAPLKNSRIDIMTNQRIVGLFLMLIVITIISVIGAEIMDRFFLTNTFYLDKFEHWSFLWNALTFFILYNNLIPISLQVTLEIVRFFQAGYINQDIKMYDENTDTPANARTSNLNEELGQVQYLMTDKTGTLTRNVMKFKKCQIAGVNYGDDEREEFDGQDMLKDMNENKENSHLIYQFLMMMATCHTVVPERNEDGELNFQAASPDEGALVRGAANAGFIFHTRKPTEITIETPWGEETFRVLNVLEFDSDRKRMSVILRDKHSRIKLYCKGADNVIFERLSTDSNSTRFLDTTQQALDEYAHKGYRTLCFAMVELDEQFYNKWSHDFLEASTSLDKRKEKLAAVAEVLEKNMQLIGVTAIEDKLQENVPETIRTLLIAGIRIWMLTGDKLETAVQIAQSSSICSKDTELLKLIEKSFDDVLKRLKQIKAKSQQLLASNSEFALVLDGASLHHAVIGEARRIFAELIVNSHSVICCRMTPIQKAEIVEIVKTLGNSTVMAVGDGANDVAMIQTANVGVGITGEEGLQAASASDYSIGQFQFLQRLILIHGTWNYERTVKVILYSFYKNICLYIIELWFAFFSAFSGVTIFERWTIACFNIFFTAWPPIILGLFDRPISQRHVLNHPQVYQSFQKMAFSNYRFILWICVSLWHSLVLFFLSYAFYGVGVLWETGRIGGWLMFGNSLYSHVVATVCFKALLETDSLTWVIVVACIFSIALWFFFLSIYSLAWPIIPLGAEMSGMFSLLVLSPNFWVSFIFIPIATLLFDFFVKSICTTFAPSPREKICLRENSKTVGCHCHITDMQGQTEEVRQCYSQEVEVHHRSQDQTVFPPTSNAQGSSSTISLLKPNNTHQTGTTTTHFSHRSNSNSAQNCNEFTSIVPNPNTEGYGTLNNNFVTNIEVESNGASNNHSNSEENPQDRKHIFFTRKANNAVVYRHSSKDTNNPVPELLISHQQQSYV